jgi:hypothetical protein
VLCACAIGLRELMHLRRSKRVQAADMLEMAATEEGTLKQQSTVPDGSLHAAVPQRDEALRHADAKARATSTSGELATGGMASVNDTAAVQTQPHCLKPDGTSTWEQPAGRWSWVLAQHRASAVPHGTVDWRWVASQLQELHGAAAAGQEQRRSTAERMQRAHPVRMSSPAAPHSDLLAATTPEPQALPAQLPLAPIPTHAPLSAAALPAGWLEYKAPNGRPYYLKPDGTTTWEKPAGRWSWALAQHRTSVVPHGTLDLHRAVEQDRLTRGLPMARPNRPLPPIVQASSGRRQKRWAQE